MFFTNFERYCAKIGKTTYFVASEIGIKSSATIAGWRAGAVPRPKVINALVKYFNENGLEIDASDFFIDDSFPTPDDVEALKVRAMLRGRPEMRILFDAAKNAPASVLLEAAARIMRLQEESDNK